MPSSNLPSAPEALLAQLLASYRERYGHVVFEVNLEQTPAGLRAHGHVLLPQQKADALQTLQAFSPVVDEIMVLSDASNAPLAWARPLDKAMDLLRHPRDDAELSTQARVEDPPLRVLWRENAWSLVQLFDYTLGWVRSAQLQETAPSSWDGVRRAVPGETVALDLDVDALLEAGRARLGQPYLLGGASENGIDCSALTQRIFWERAGVLLPKFTGDQRRMGLRVSRSATEKGDLLFFKSRDHNFGHVALALDNGGNTLLHASLRNGCVCVEPFEKVSAAYAYLGARRIARFAAHTPRSAPLTPKLREPIDLSRPETLRGYYVCDECAYRHDRSERPSSYSTKLASWSRRRVQELTQAHLKPYLKNSERLHESSNARG